MSVDKLIVVAVIAAAFFIIRWVVTQDKERWGFGPFEGVTRIEYLREVDCWRTLHEIQAVNANAAAAACTRRLIPWDAADPMAVRYP